MCTRANERENERELQLIRAASQIFFFFSLFYFFFARGRARAPCESSEREKKKFRATRLVPAPKVHRDSKRMNFFFAPSASCLVPVPSTDSSYARKCVKKCFSRFARGDCVFCSIQQMQTAIREEPATKISALRALCLRVLLHPSKMQ